MSLKFAALGGLTVLSALGSPARVDEQAQNLGPVKPYEPTLITFGHRSSATKRKICCWRKARSSSHDRRVKSVTSNAPGP
jgi:hypothetical protein